MKKNKLKTLSLLLVTCLLAGCGQANVNFKNAIVFSELGEPISTDIYDYVSIDKDVPLEDAYVDVSEADIYKVGTYPITVKYLDSTLSFDVKVEDTTAPDLDVSDIEIPLYSTVSANDIATATDLSDVEVCFVIDDEEVSSFDGSEIGFYNIEVRAKDKYNNETTKFIEINVYEKEDNYTMDEEDNNYTEDNYESEEDESLNKNSVINPFFIPNASSSDETEGESADSEKLEEGAYIDEETGEVVYTQYPMSMSEFFDILNATYTETKSYN